MKDMQTKLRQVKGHKACQVRSCTGQKQSSLWRSGFTLAYSPHTSIAVSMHCMGLEGAPHHAIMQDDHAICYNRSDCIGEAGYLSSAEARWRSRVRRSSSTLSARACALASASFTLFPSPSLALAAAFSSAAACQ